MIGTTNVFQWWVGSGVSTEASECHSVDMRRGRAVVRALVLYPMNALVEDQLSRLRRALDSPEARRWYSRERAGNKVYFGRYNGCDSRCWP